MLIPNFVTSLLFLLFPHIWQEVSHIVFFFFFFFNTVSTQQVCFMQIHGNIFLKSRWIISSYSIYSLKRNWSRYPKRFLNRFSYSSFFPELLRHQIIHSDVFVPSEVESACSKVWEICAVGCVCVCVCVCVCMGWRGWEGETILSRSDSIC